MFATLESFSLFFFISLAVIVLAIIFEDKLIALEKKHDKKRASKNSYKKATSNNKSQRPSVYKKSVSKSSVTAKRKNGIAA